MLPPDAVITHVECTITGYPTQRVTIRRGEVGGSGIEVHHLSPYDVHIVLNDRGAALLEHVGFAVLRSDGNRVWLRTQGERTAVMEL